MICHFMCPTCSNITIDSTVSLTYTCIVANWFKNKEESAPTCSQPAAGCGDILETDFSGDN